MAGTTPIYGIPYPESSDLVANYPALGEGLADKLEDKLPTLSATAPTSPSVGQVWIDSTGSPIGKVWDGSAWTIFSGAGSANFSDTATGTYTDGGIDYKYVTYTGSGTLTVTTAGFADVLVVGGGAGGGTSFGGGGGAGGYLAITNAYFAVGVQTVVIGAGGAGAAQNATYRPAGSNGIASQVASYYGVGGGGAGSEFGGSSATKVGFSGGSGGGGSLNTAGGAGTSGQGNTGGTGGSTSGGGGGGAGAVGSNGSGSTGGAGGAGTSSSLDNVATTRAGGGGGGSNGIAGAGGAGGGGAGTNNNATGTAGTANTGGGGGGGGQSGVPGGAGGAGGSGVVIIRVVV